MKLRDTGRNCLAVSGVVFRRGGPHPYVLLVASLLAGLVPPAAAWGMAHLLEGLAAPDATAAPTAAVAVIAAAGAGGLFVPHVLQYAQSCLNRSVETHMQNEIFGKLGRLPYLSSFEDPTLLNRVNLAQETAHAVPGQIAGGAFSSLQSLTTIIGFSAALAAVEPLLLLAVLAVAVHVLFVEIAMSRLGAEAMRETMTAARRQTFYRVMLTGASTMQEAMMLGLGTFWLGRLRADLAQSHRALGAVDRKSLARQVPVLVANALVVAGAMYWVATEVAKGRLSIGDVTIVLSGIAALTAGFAAMASTAGGTVKGLLLFDDYRALMALPERRAAAAHRAAAPLTDRISVRDLWFRYAEDSDWVLRGVSFDLVPGTTTALVGVNGAGKSTLVKLLCGLYEPTRGAVRWDGTDIRALGAEGFRDRIATVFQDFVSHDLTAAQNIGIGDLPHATDRGRIRDAARAADVDRIIDGLPRGYDTYLSRAFLSNPSGDRQSPVSLSGGQWQRLAIGRAFMRADRDLVILDEPGSGMDAGAEADMGRRMGEFAPQAAKVLVSHRMNAVRTADHIVVLKDGLVAEAGSHEALMRLGGEYHRLFESQASGYRSAPAEAPRAETVSGSAS
ncbi:ABC transporter ATP-binding protein [Streptomyces sp. NPDC059917]|uniref:ABC transporter ATP-binding protein n=1 Tax=Streptomyces sp. NPDC059917 TaxID=3347002 RepID=UPI0036597B08